MRRPKNMRYETKSFALALNTGCPEKTPVKDKLISPRKQAFFLGHLVYFI